VRLLFFSNVYPNPIQPTKGTFNRELVKAMARIHELQVVSPISWIDEWRARGNGAIRWNDGRRASLDGVPVHYPRYWYPPKVMRRWYGWFLGRSVRGAVDGVLRSHRPEAVLAYWAHPDGQVAVSAALSIGVPAVVMVGGSDVLLLTREPSRRRRILHVLQHSDAVVTTSNDLKTKVGELGVPADKVHVVGRGVDSSLFHPGDRRLARAQLGIPENRPMLLWVGRMVPIKGLDVLLKSCKLLRARQVSFRLCLVGDGGLKNSLEMECAALGLTEVVSFAGPVAHDGLPNWYRAADLTVLPSRSEGIPNVLRESHACGTPFVASRVGGIHEIADESCDRLVVPNDPEALADAIEQSLRQPRFPELPRAQPVGWAESADALSAILENVVAVRRPRQITVECGIAAND
jgi:glycosyltransferase involved in cell wall biosynthesis